MAKFGLITGRPDDFETRLAPFAEPNRGNGLPDSSLERSNLFAKLRQETSPSAILTELAFRFGAIDRDEREDFEDFLERKLAEYQMQQADGYAPETDFACEETLYAEAFGMFREIVQDRSNHLFDEVLNKANHFGCFVVAQAAEVQELRRRPA